MNKKGETKTKRLIAVLLTLLMMAASMTSLPLIAAAETSGIYTYTVSEGEATITDCDSSASGESIIPSTLGGCPVTTIGDYAFEYCKKLKSIYIPETVTTIGESAFRNCYNLEKISVSEENENYTSIDGNLYSKDKSVFIQYALGKDDDFFSLPDGVKSIGAYAFAYSLILSVVLPDSVTKMEKYAFSGCYFKAVCLSNALTSIEEGAFENCEFWDDFAIPKSVKRIGKKAFYNCYGLGEVRIQGKEISIEDNAFDGSDLETIFFGGTEEDWENVQIGSGNECVERADMHYGYGDTASGDCGEELTWNIDDNGLLTISGMGCDIDFEGRRAPWYEMRDLIRAVSVSENVGYICYDAFLNCYFIETVEILGSVVYFDPYVFRNCLRLRSIQLPDEMEYINVGTFSGCQSLQSIEIPEMVYSIEDYAFEDCQSLTDIEIPKAVEYIGVGAFSGCKNLKSIEISENVEEIGGSAFSNSGLESISVAEDNPFYCTINGSLYTKDKTKFMQYVGPKTETEFIVPDGVTKIMSGAFEGVGHLTSIILPQKLKLIYSGAFYDCEGLTDIVIPSGVLEIGSYAFSGCKNLKKIEIPFSVTYIEEDAFFLCNDLEDVIYEGSRELWSEIEFGEGNDALLNASVLYQNYNVYMQYDMKTDKLLIIGNNNVEDDEAVLLVAAYKDNEIFPFKTMISCKTMTVSIFCGESGAWNLLQNIEGADRIQFMLWDSTSMLPMAKAIEKKF